MTDLLFDPDEGFQFSLGHGVGLAVHEAPSIGMKGDGVLVPGDVVAIEPGLWVREIGECGSRTCCW